jgi:hypothetical protein
MKVVRMQSTKGYRLWPDQIPQAALPDSSCPDSSATVICKRITLGIAGPPGCPRPGGVTGATLVRSIRRRLRQPSGTNTGLAARAPAGGPRRRKGRSGGPARTVAPGPAGGWAGQQPKTPSPSPRAMHCYCKIGPGQLDSNLTEARDSAPARPGQHGHGHAARSPAARAAARALRLSGWQAAE